MNDERLRLPNKNVPDALPFTLYCQLLKTEIRACPHVTGAEEPGNALSRRLQDGGDVLRKGS